MQTDIYFLMHEKLATLHESPAGNFYRLTVDGLTFFGSCREHVIYRAMTHVGGAA